MMMKLFNCLMISGLLLANTASAQRIEINIGGGVVSNLAPQLNDSWTTNKYGGMSGTAAFSILGNVHKHWQVGVSVGAVPLSYKTQSYYPLMFEDARDMTSFLPYSNEYYKDYLSNPAIPVQLVVNYKMSAKKIHFHTGISAGYFLNGGYYSYRVGDYWSRGNSEGLVAGMQMGGTWQFSRIVGVNMDLAMSYYEPYRTIAFPATVGLKFCL